MASAIKVNAVSLDETRHFTIQDEDKSYIKKINAVYAYDWETATNCCELTPSYELVYLYTYIVFEAEVSDEKRDELDTRYCYEDNEDIYMHCKVVRKLETKGCGLHESMEAAREYLRGNCPF